MLGNIIFVLKRDVVQVYVTAPEGRLTKPYQELKGYRKTKELKSGETQTVTITIPTESLSSFDTGKSAFIMEPGDYLLRMGSSSRDTETVGVTLLLPSPLTDTCATPSLIGADTASCFLAGASHVLSSLSGRNSFLT